MPIRTVLLMICATLAAADDQPAVTSATSAEHYTWGNCCDGWYLVKTPELNIIQERMPPGTSETLHKHQKARQFFFVLSGEASIEREGKLSIVHAGEGLEVPPGIAHKVVNKSRQKLEILVTSQPPSHGDRIDLEAAPK